MHAKADISSVHQAVEDVAEAGKCCILDIDVQGARQVTKSIPSL